MSTNTSLVSRIAQVARLSIAAVLVLSAMLHLQQPFFFASTIASYRIVPFGTEFLFSLGIGSFQFVLGVALFLSHRFSLYLKVSFLLFGLFAFMQVRLLALDEDVNCGCFGFAAGKVSWASVAIPAGLGMVCLVGLQECATGATRTSGLENC